MIEIANVRKFFGALDVLKGIDLTVADGEVLSVEPYYMLFDEVTSALDPDLVGEVLDTMRMLASEGMTMMLVTHEMSFARDVSDRVAFFRQGVMEEVGPAREVMTSPKSAHLQKFLSNVR